MIWLLGRPLTPSPVSKLSLFLSLPVCRQVELTDGKEGEVVGEEPNQTLPSMYYSILSGFFPLFTNVWASEKMDGHDFL
jgi:hypothetical protein